MLECSDGEADLIDLAPGILLEMYRGLLGADHPDRELIYCAGAYTAAATLLLPGGRAMSRDDKAEWCSAVGRLAAILKRARPETLEGVVALYVVASLIREARETAPGSVLGSEATAQLCDHAREALGALRQPATRPELSFALSPRGLQAVRAFLCNVNDDRRVGEPLCEALVRPTDPPN